MVILARAIEAEQIRLDLNRQARSVPFEEVQTLVPGEISGQIFLSHDN
ncbi:hypothetical protein J2Z70_004277 [Paenibacillus silagei]|uniref:Uncharacterized protein n=1 Tax=Paenibacillus silagei TaxID=1670801 RepID=A0ABS4NVN3_9BACL|nr:hypothetical protein [Paenibacillus silagei]